jgi:hypothetical protein
MLASILLIPYALLLHPGYWLIPVPASSPIHGVGSYFLQEWLAVHPMWLPAVVITALFVQGVLANFFYFSHRLGPATNLFGGVFVILLGSFLPAFLPFSGYHLANIFLFLAILALFQVYRVSSAADHIFNAGFWLGVASLFQVQYLFFLLAAITGLTIFRKSSLREAFILLLGYLTPWVLAGFGFFWYDAFGLFWEIQVAGALGWPQNISLAEFPVIELGGWLILLLVVLFSYNRYTLKTTMEIQKEINLLFWFLLCAAFIGLFSQPWSLASLMGLAPALGLLLGLHFSYFSKSVAEFWHFVLVIGLLFWQLLPLLPWQ